MYDFAKDVFPALLDAGKEIDGFLVQGRWTDIGNHEMYRNACKWKLDKISGSARTPTPRIRDPVMIGGGSDIAESSMIVGPVVIGEDTTIGARVLIGPYTTIGSNCTIEDDAHILTSHIYDNVRIGKGSLIFSSIIDNDCHVHENCSLETGTVLGSRAVVSEGAILSGVRIWSDNVVERGGHLRSDVVD
jgi:mannose-1-phosphate guanylyltransferase